nr:23S rRNA (adenine(2030)-N(6))-methyltransferase RlmJ [uncultured Neokomagataea sp.]
MNYRHAYHAGNFADCMKHALLLSLLRALSKKKTGFCVLDTHAGLGHYDLQGIEAEKTGEWHDGIARLLGQDIPALAEYQSAVEALGLYPGSPAFTQHVLRPQDHLMACELHPEDVKPLRRRFRGLPNVSVHHRDGYEALRALLPPKDVRRGLVLIDPPFEKPDDFTRCADAISYVRNHFRAGIVAVWFPIKHRTPIHAFYNSLKDAKIPDLITCEFLLRPPLDPSQLNGCGILVANAPYGFEAEARTILDALAQHLTTADNPAIDVRIERLTEE